MPAVAVAGVVVSAYAASQQSKAANKSLKQQQSAQDQQMQFARENLDFQRGRYTEWKDTFMPVFNDLRDETYAARNPDYASISADVNAAYDTSRDINLRNLERYGIKPTDGAVWAADTAYGLGRASETVRRRQQERWGVTAQRLAGLQQLYQMGEGWRSDAAAGMSNAYGSAGNAQGQAADRYGQQADSYGRAAGASASQAWQGAAGLAASYYGGRGGGGSSNAAGWSMSGFGGQRSPWDMSAPQNFGGRSSSNGYGMPYWGGGHG